MSASNSQSTDKPISVGDLVMVVRGPSCCGRSTGTEGTIFKVNTIIDADKYPCRLCKQIPNDRRAAAGSGMTYSFYVHRLKRIPPPEELGLARTDETIKGLA